MVPDNNLLCAILRKLVEIEPHIANGVLIQAYDEVERLHVPDAFVVEGYEGRGHAINEHLKMLVRRDFVNGDEDTGLAIFFRRVTRQGHAFLAECET